MIRKYSRILEERQINNATDEVWALQDVPNTWRSKTEAKVIADGFYFDEDGTAYPIPENEEE